MEEEERGRVWRLYGWYSGLMACGSCVGAVAWAAEMISYVYFFEAYSSATLAKQLSLRAHENAWFAVFLVTYGIEFLCLSAAKLMVLDRMSVFAAPQGTGMRRRWAAAGRVVMAVVVLGNAVGLAANVAAAVHYQNTSEAHSAASAYYAANNTKDGEKYLSLSKKEAQLGGSIASVQSVCEVAVLLLIVVAFVAVGVLSARRVSSRLLGVDAASAAAATGRALRLQMVGTTAFVFVTFLIRSVFSTMYAVALELRNIDKDCPGLEKFTYCDACYNHYTHIVGWIFFTPEFQSTIVLISSPVALLVALWGMTSKATLQLMKSSRQESAMSLRRVALNEREKATMPQSVLGE
jgi:hypothetical protein